MLIRYARVSKSDGSQSLDLQRDALITAGVNEEQIYSDQASGKKDDRPGLAACLRALREGDVLVIWKLDRMGRSLNHLVKTTTLLSERGVGLKVLTGQRGADRHNHRCRSVVVRHFCCPDQIRERADPGLPVPEVAKAVESSHSPKRRFGCRSTQLPLPAGCRGAGRNG